MTTRSTRISGPPGDRHASPGVPGCNMRRGPQRLAVARRQSSLGDRWRGRRRAWRSDNALRPGPRRCLRRLRLSPAQFLAVRPASGHFPDARRGPCEFRSPVCAAKLRTKAARTIPRTPGSTRAKQRSWIDGRPVAPETATGRFAPIQERLVARLSSFFALLALILACVGLYGLLSYEVSRRTREIGIRMALGAHPGSVLKLVLRQGIVLAIVGAAAGIGVALGVTRYLTSMLYNVHANDPLTMIAVALLLTFVALAACYIPARRAMRVDPLVALRYE